VDEISGKQEPTSIRVFHRTDRVSGYKPTLLIMKNADEYEKMLKMAKEELRIFKNKYSSLSELEKVFDAIDEL
jgi:dsDNA-binding SOS-regulon protein